MSSNRVAGTVLGVLLVICGFLSWRILVLTRGGFAEAPETVTEAGDGGADDVAAEAFLSALERDRNANYIAFAAVGLTGNGVSAQTEDVVVQRNGQRLINRDNSIIYERNGESETCRLTFEELFCTPPAPVTSAADEAAEVRSYLVGTEWRYKVKWGLELGCFDLTLDLSKGALVADFGLESSYCFDGRTGALVSREVRRVNRTETYVVDLVDDVPERDDLAGTFPQQLLDRFFE